MKDVSDQNHDAIAKSIDDDVHARREFLKKCGKYALVVPPAMTLLLTREANAVCPTPSVGC